MVKRAYAMSAKSDGGKKKTVVNRDMSQIHDVICVSSNDEFNHVICQAHLSYPKLYYLIINYKHSFAKKCITHLKNVNLYYINSYNSLYLKTDKNEHLSPINDVDLHLMILYCDTSFKTLCQAIS